jgi:Uma2 family endonuclease
MALPERYRFSVADYELMIEAGILTEDDRVELLAGEIVEMGPIGGEHVGRVNVVSNRLVRQVDPAVIVSVQNPIRLSDDSEPQPDIALLRPGTPTHAVPLAADVLLLIEVAESSRDTDRSVKFPLYAAAGIPEAWLVDLAAGVIERHTEPRNGRYTLVALAGRGESLPSTVLPHLVFAADDVLR